MAYNDATLWALHDIGYRQLYGVDLNKYIYDCKYYTQIKYKYGNIENTHFPDSFFDIGICLSVIEHKVNLKNFFIEAKRVLKNESYLFITTDFSMGKLYPKNGDSIFSYKEILNIISIAKSVGFVPMFKTSELPKLVNSENPIYFKGLWYSFVFLGFKLNKRYRYINKPIKKISILSYSLGKNGGISKYAKLLGDRLEKENGVMVKLYNNVDDVNTDTTKIVLIEYHPALRNVKDLISDIKYLKRMKKRIYVEVHEHLGVLSEKQRESLEKNATMLYRANEFAEHDTIKNYFLVTQMSYTNIKINNNVPKEILVGTFGYVSKEKRIKEIIQLLTRLKVKGLFILGFNSEIKNSDTSTKMEVKRIMHIAGRNNNIEVINKGQLHPKDKQIIIELGTFSDKENIAELKKCTHFVFAQRQSFAPSGSMVYVKRFNDRPIISLDTYQSKFSGVIRVKILNSVLPPLYDATFDFIWHIRTEKRILFKKYLINVYHILKARPITREFLDKSKEFLPIKEDDGYEYLISVLNLTGRGK